jgi:hypothetical protein
VRCSSVVVSCHSFISSSPHFCRAAKERNQAQQEISRENLKKQREEQERHRMALIEKLQAKYGQIEGEPVFVTKM